MGMLYGQYFYDSLQISRLEDISLISYYQMGFGLRTDSLASFFDALIIQLTNNWTIVRTMRVISLLLVIVNSLELTFNLEILILKEVFFNFNNINDSRCMGYSSFRET